MEVHKVQYMGCIYMYMTTCTWCDLSIVTFCGPFNCGLYKEVVSLVKNMFVGNVLVTFIERWS